MSSNIQNLNDDQLDGIVGGAALPAAFDQYINSMGGISIGSSNANSSKTLSVKADTEVVSSYLDKLESKGVTNVTLYYGDGSQKGDAFTIAQVREMLG